MARCPKCGTEATEEDEFCHSCGASLKAKTEEPLMKEIHVREREMCFGEERRRRDYTGLVSFGIFLLIVGFVFIANPNIVSEFRSWIETMTSQQTLSRPPQGLITSAALFFGLIGVSNFFTAGIRFIGDKGIGRAFGDILSGIALILFSYLIYLYGTHTLTWQMVLAIEIVACGLLVIVYSTVRYLYPTKPQKFQ